MTAKPRINTELAWSLLKSSWQTEVGELRSERSPEACITAIREQTNRMLSFGGAKFPITGSVFGVKFSLLVNHTISTSWQTALRGKVVAGANGGALIKYTAGVNPATKVFDVFSGVFVACWFFGVIASVILQPSIIVLVIFAGGVAIATLMIAAQIWGRWISRNDTEVLLNFLRTSLDAR